MKHALALKKRLGMPAKSFATIDCPNGTDPVADSSNDTLTLTATGNITITGDSTTDTVDFNVPSQNVFTTIDCPSGTDPVADNSSDTLTLLASGPLTITGDSSTDTITFAATGPTFGFTTIATTSGTAPVADAAADTLTLTAGTGISVTGNSTTDTVTFAVTATLAQIITNGGTVDQNQTITFTTTTGGVGSNTTLKPTAGNLTFTALGLGPVMNFEIITFFKNIVNMDTDKEFRFRSSANRIYSSATNTLVVEAGTTLNLTATTVVTSASLTVGTTTTLNSITYTWPSSIGSGTRFLFCNSGGTMSWINPLGTTNTWTAQQTFTGNIVVGSSGTAVQAIYANGASLNFGSTSASSSSDLTVTVTGASVGDMVALGVPDTAITSGTNMGNCAFWAWVSSANTVTVRFVNNDPSSAADPAAAVFKIAVFKF